MTRSFPGALALDGVSLDLLPGEVHAIVGENGAGKSTLINVLSGVLRPDAGSIRLEGSIARLGSPRESRRLGIATVHQEADHFAELSVAENMALLHDLPRTRWSLVDWKSIIAAAQEAVAELGEPLDVRQSAKKLSIAQLHMIQVAAAIRRGARVVILDEPTSALSEPESEWLFRQIKRLQANSAGIIYISHRQDEVFRLANRITVLRDGKRVWHGKTNQTDRQQLVESMVGRSLDTSGLDRVKHLPADRPPRLSVNGLTDRSGRFRNVDLTLNAGEIVGMYGLVGAGRSEFAQAVFGYRPIKSGSIKVDGVPTRVDRIRDAVSAGIAYVPEDRLRQSVFRGLSVRANLVMATLDRWRRGPLMSKSAERAASQRMTEQMSVQHQSAEQPIAQLSGGNQQKVILARWLLSDPHVLLLDEPTRGVDIGAKAEIHRLLAELAESGRAILLISSDLTEVLAHSDRIVVFRNGEISGDFARGSASSAEIAAAAFPETTQEPGRRPLPPTARRRSGAARVTDYLAGEMALFAAVVLLVAWTMATSQGFSFVTLLSNASVWILLGLAAAIVIIGGGIDISLGSLVALSAATTALVLQIPGPPALIVPLGVAAGVLVGGLGGALNAAIALAGGIHPIVVTLGTMTIYRGAVIALLGGQAFAGLPAPFLRLAHDPVTGLRGSIVIAAVTTILAACWLTYTRLGRHIYAVGAGPRAAELAGIKQSTTWGVGFSVGGALAGLAGVVQLAQSGQMQSQLGAGWELHAIAVAVIGGVAITGGRGTVTGVVLGAMLVRLINGALVRWGIRDVQFDLFVGAMILGAVLVDLIWKKSDLSLREFLLPFR